MAILSTVLCDCCGINLTDQSVTHATTLMYLNDEGSVTSSVFGTLCGCGPRLVANAQLQREIEHDPGTNTLPTIPGAARRPEPQDSPEPPPAEPSPKPARAEPAQNTPTT